MHDSLKAAWLRVLSEESGQDVIEYALLTAVIAVAGILTWVALANKAYTSYSAVDSNVQGLARPSDPQ
jgi:Flp pilus assembly pilin Flp